MHVAGESVVRPTWWLEPRYARWVPLAAAFVALVICLQRFTIDGALFGITEYDDGVYLGGAIRLAHGSMPYRDFAFPHPPGIPLLYLPFALLGRIGSTRTLMALARVATAFVAAGNVWLLGRLLRHRGIVPSLAASLGLAVFPLALHANKTLLIEPYVVFFSLLGAVLILDGDQPARGRRLVFGGVALGFALAVKLWALLPVIGILVACIPGWRSRWRPLLGSLVAGAVVPCLPFFLASPGSFIRQVFVVQLLRGEAWYSSPFTERLVLILGLRPFPLVAGAQTAAVVIAVAVVVFVVGVYLVRRQVRPLDTFALVTVVVSLIAVLTSSDFFPHYAYFTGAFIALMLGAAGGAALAAVPGRGWSTGVLHGVLIAGVLTAALVGDARGRGVVRSFGDALTIGDFGPEVAAAITPGACVLTDEPALIITANRFVADGPCPAVVDPFYEWLNENPKQVPPLLMPYDADPDLVERWRDWLSQADFVVLSYDSFRIPWYGDLDLWFQSSFEQVAAPGPVVYRRIPEPGV